MNVLQKKLSLPLKIIKSNGAVPRLEKEFIKNGSHSWLGWVNERGWQSGGQSMQGRTYKNTSIIVKQMSTLLPFCITFTNYTSKVNRGNISPLGDITGWEKLSSSLRSFVNNTDIYIGCMEFKLKNTNLNKNPRLFPNKMLSFILTPTTSLGLFCSWFWLSLQGCSQASHKEDRIRQLTFSSCHFKSITGLDLNLHEKYPYE